MHLLQKTNKDQVCFIIIDAPAQYHEAIRSLAFREEAEGFVKELPNAIAHLDTAFARYERDLETIVQQAAHEIPVPWEKAFDSFLHHVADIQADWWVTGSLALTLRGLAIEPGDIDLIVDGKGAVQWGEALAEYMIEPVFMTNWFCKYWGRAFDHARVEWVGEIDPQSDFGYVRDYYLPSVNNLETIDWHGYAVRIPPIEPMLKIEEARGRLDRVRVIQQALGL